MATYSYSGYDDDQITWPGGTPTNGDTITFTQATDHVVEITDNDSRLEDGTDDRDDEDSSQTAVVYDEFGAVEASGQVQPRDEITLTDGTNTYFMTEVFIASSNSYYYIFHDPPPELGVEYTVTNVANPNSTNYSELSTAGIACFTAGTLIATPAGGVPIELLGIGDMVCTLDRGPQPIRFAARRRVTWHETKQRKGLRPIIVRADALGAGRPLSDTMFSRQHRLLLRDSDVDAAVVGPRGVLVAVHTLTALTGIEELCPMAGVSYHHLLTDTHNILCSNGLPTESLLMTSVSADLLGIDRDAARARVPDAPLSAMCPARPLLHNRIARNIVGKGGIGRQTSPGPQRGPDAQDRQELGVSSRPVASLRNSAPRPLPSRR